MLMGGTGVGKSTLLNALAGAAVADASFARPTTREPVVYHHQSVAPDRLDPSFRNCRLVAHDRPALMDKIIVDTPDLDSNDLANRDKLAGLLPLSDVVLYVGSQEKYHDKLGWDLFLAQRRRRAFAFVLNKWDRCLHAHAPGGLRPDDDLLRDLRAEGFQNPLLFRTCAQPWLDRQNGAAADAPALPEGEQFTELVHWLEHGLTRLEIEAIKARGIGQFFTHLETMLADACLPDLRDVAKDVRESWVQILDDDADQSTQILLNSVEPFQRRIEQHFSAEGYKRFRGLMAVYLNVFTKARFVGSTLRVPLLPKLPQALDTTKSWDLSALSSAWSNAAGEQHLDSRMKALTNRLLVDADRRGFPVELLTEPTEKAGDADWHQRHAAVLLEVLDQIEQQWVKPTGTRRLLQSSIIWIANRLPLVAILGTCFVLLWQYIVAEPRRSPALGDLLLPLIVVFLVLFILHVLIFTLLPMRWESIRGEFQRQLDKRLKSDLIAAYAGIPGELAETIQRERKQVEKLIRETREIGSWVSQRQQSAQIDGLYGN
jgi:energy-coupling factor transporter ATP-binding protein EcfA2